MFIYYLKNCRGQDQGTSWKPVMKSSVTGYPVAHLSLWILLIQIGTGRQMPMECFMRLEFTSLWFELKK